MTKLNAENCKNCSSKCAYDCSQVQAPLHSFILYFLFQLIGVVFSNGAMLPMLAKYDSVNERTQEISGLVKLHVLGVWQNAHEIY